MSPVSCKRWQNLGTSGKSSGVNSDGTPGGTKATRGCSVSTGAITKPSRPPVATTPLATPRSPNATQRLRMRRRRLGMPPPAQFEENQRLTTASNEAASPTRPIARDHSRMYSDNMRRLPKRSLNQPAGTWPRE